VQNDKNFDSNHLASVLAHGMRTARNRTHRNLPISCHRFGEKVCKHASEGFEGFETGTVLKSKTDFVFHIDN